MCHTEGFFNYEQLKDNMITIGGEQIFTIAPEFLQLVNNYRDQCQRFQVWCQWWLQYIDPINLGSSCLPAFLCPFHYPDIYTSLIWYGPDGLEVWHLWMKFWSPGRLDKGVHHGFHCDTQLPGCLCRRWVHVSQRRRCHIRRSGSEFLGGGGIVTCA